MKLVFLALALATASAASAQLNGDGYYRIQNSKTERYIYVYDNKGSINFATTSADLNAVQLWKGFDKAVSDPASIIYIKKVSKDEYDLHSQGTSTYDIIGYHVKIYKRSNGTYNTYATYSGSTIYLSDVERSVSEDGSLDTNGSGEYRNWNIIPVTTDDGAYFGVKPDVAVGGNYYTTLYADFAFTTASAGMKAFYVNKVDNDMAVMRDIAEGEVVPANTAVVIQSTSDAASANKLNLLANSAKPAADNLLGGVYFNNPSKGHNNQKKYDPSTMRVLGTLADGSIGFVKSDIAFLPANEAYLKVPAGSPDEIKLVTEEQYAAGVDHVVAETTNGKTAVYTLTGVKVKDDASSLDGLSSGVYIVGKKKVVVK